MKPTVYVEEITEGDPGQAEKRRGLIDGITSVEVTAEALSFAQSLVLRRVVPETATTDALHIAIAAASGMEYLMTWNCRHIANAQLRARIDALARSLGFEPPVLCTPEELMEIGR